MLVDTALESLTSELPGDVVITDPDRMANYRWDRANDPGAGVPLAVVRAESTAHVQTVMRFASAHGLAVVPRGAGSDA
jgi:glycolate oxidase